jgi:hypothetical protein
MGKAGLQPGQIKKEMNDENDSNALERSKDRPGATQEGDAMRSDLIPAVKGFCRNVLDAEKLPPGTKIELIGPDNSPFYDMIATGKDDGGTWQFSKHDQWVATLPQAVTVQFTVAGRPPFTRECRL